MPAKRETSIEIPGDWQRRDRHLTKLAAVTGFQTVNRLLSHMAYEISHCRTPSQLYRGLSSFYESARRNRK